VREEQVFYFWGLVEYNVCALPGHLDPFS